MATSRDLVNALIRYSVAGALQDSMAFDSCLAQRTRDLLYQIERLYPVPEPKTVIASLCSELQSLGIIKTPEQSRVFADSFTDYRFREPLVIIANVLLVADDSRFNSQIWPRTQRLQAYFERVNELFSARPCQDGARESMVDLLHGQFFFSPGEGDGEPLYLFRNFDTDCLKVITEYYANRLAPLLLHAELAERQRGFLILTDWIRYHHHQGAISKRLVEFLDNRLTLHCHLHQVLRLHDIVPDLSNSVETIVRTPVELPPPYMPTYAQTTLTASEIGHYNGVISTLHDLIRDPNQQPVELISQFLKCRTLEDVFPIRFALIRKAALNKAAQFAKTIPLHPVHHRAVKSATELVSQYSQLSDSEFAENLDTINSRLGECHLLLDSDEHGRVPDYFGELFKESSSHYSFKLVYWKLQERAFSCIEDDSILKLLQAAETSPFFSLLSPRRFAYLLWPAFNISPKDWSKAYATLVDRIHRELVGKSIRSYPNEFRAQLCWLHQCWESGNLCPIPDRLYMPCNLSGLRADAQYRLYMPCNLSGLHADAQYSHKKFLWWTSTRNRGWWVGLPNDMTLTDISTDISDIHHMLSLCSYSQRLRELEKIWDTLVRDPAVFPMLFRVLKLDEPEHVQTLQVFFPKIPPGQVQNCLKEVKPFNAVFFHALNLTRPDQLAAVLEKFFAEFFDRAFFQKYDALFATLPNPEVTVCSFRGELKLKIYRAVCLAFPDSKVNSLFSTHEEQVVATQIYAVKKILAMITLFAKENQLTLSTAASRLYKDFKLDRLIELWDARVSAPFVLRELLSDVNSLINMKALLNESDECDVEYSPRK